MCSLKPNSEACAAEIKKGVSSTGCGGCPVSKGIQDTCASTHKNAALKKMSSATNNALGARIQASSAAKNLATA